MAYTYTPQHNTKEPATTTTRDDAMTTEQQPSVLFHALAVSKTTSIEECVSTNYGSWRALLNAMKEMQRNEDSRFSRVNVEQRAHLSVSFHQWGTRQLKERSPMFADEFEKFVNCKEIVESLMEDFEDDLSESCINDLNNILSHSRETEKAIEKFVDFIKGELKPEPTDESGQSNVKNAESLFKSLGDLDYSLEIDDILS